MGGERIPDSIHPGSTRGPAPSGAGSLRRLLQTSVTEHYGVFSPDARFLVNTVLDEQSTPITLVQNWQPPEAK